MKPYKNEIRYKIKFTGLELVVLHKLTGKMCEAYGLDRKIDAYKGVRAITLYSWDLDCLDAVLNTAVGNPAGEGISNTAELEMLQSLEIRVRNLIDSRKALQ